MAGSRRSRQVREAGSLEGISVTIQTAQPCSAKATSPASCSNSLSICPWQKSRTSHYSGPLARILPAQATTPTVDAAVGCLVPLPLQRSRPLLGHQGLQCESRPGVCGHTHLMGRFTWSSVGGPGGHILPLPLLLVWRGWNSQHSSAETPPGLSPPSQSTRGSDP